MVFNFANPFQEFVFEGNIIERVQTFKYWESYSRPPRTWTVQWNI
jgi:hypothetical protein